ncbi:MAG: hypothetical protein IK139_08535 [Lachnospiraceae bacterium]|nr:hypothetical protein [Lachnospiraceae bacterium]
MGIGINGLGNLQDGIVRSFADRPADTKDKKKEFGNYKDTFEHGYDPAAAASYDRKLNMIHNVEKTENSAPELSERAKKLLEELKERFGNTDFFVADYSSEEEASRILSGTEKEYGVLMTADELEKMAADEEYKEKIFGVIEQGQSTIDEFRNSLSEEELESVKSIGFTVSDDGTMKFFAELQKQSEKNAERIEKLREERRSEEKDIKDRQDKRIDEEEGKFPMVRRFVKADSIGELADALRDFLAAKEEATADRIDVQA